MAKQMPALRSATQPMETKEIESPAKSALIVVRSFGTNMKISDGIAARIKYGNQPKMMGSLSLTVGSASGNVASFTMSFIRISAQCSQFTT